jgi:hypothetical protein
MKWRSAIEWLSRFACARLIHLNWDEAKRTTVNREATHKASGSADWPHSFPFNLVHGAPNHLPARKRGIDTWPL